MTEQAIESRRTRKPTLEMMSISRDRIGQVVRFTVAFELFRWFLLAPLGAGILRLGLERWGRCSVGNFEIIKFLLSPPGLAAALGVGTIALTTVYLEIAGLMLLLADPQATWWRAFHMLGKRFVAVLGLGLRQLILLAVIAVPFLAGIGFVLRSLWAGRDLNGLIVLKPPIFWIGVGVGACLMGTCAAIGGYLLLRWWLALPVLLFEPHTRAGNAMSVSAGRTRGRRVGILRSVIVWLVVVGLSMIVLMSGLRFGSGWLLNHAGLSLHVLLPVTAVLLILHALIAAMLSVMASASLAALVLALYREFPGPATPGAGGPLQATGVQNRLPGRWRVVALTAVLIAAVPAVCYAILARVQMRENLEITAHRCGAALAPENTLAAVRKSIEARADWAELDVQRTADGVIVVLHDADLARIGGLQKRVSESTLSQIKSIDIGSKLGGEFRGERVPTLDEVIAAAGDRIQLNIELKPNGPADVAPLVQAVLDSLRRANITHRCRLCSQSYEGIQLARRMEPGLQIGFIAGGQIGDLSKLNVSFLMVAGRLATRKLVDTAAVRGVKVHAWTVNDPEMLVSLLDRGLANIITDNPVAMRNRLEEIQKLSLAERLLLRAHSLLAD